MGLKNWVGKKLEARRERIEREEAEKERIRKENERIRKENEKHRDEEKLAEIKKLLDDYYAIKVGDEKFFVPPDPKRFKPRREMTSLIRNIEDVLEK